MMSTDTGRAAGASLATGQTGLTTTGWVPLALIFGLAALVPFAGNDYWVLIATRAAV